MSSSSQPGISEVQSLSPHYKDYSTYQLSFLVPINRIVVPVRGGVCRVTHAHVRFLFYFIFTHSYFTVKQKRHPFSFFERFFTDNRRLPVFKRLADNNDYNATTAVTNSRVILL